MNSSKEDRIWKPATQINCSILLPSSRFDTTIHFKIVDPVVFDGVSCVPMIPKEEEVKRAEQAAVELQSSVTSIQKLRLAEFWYE